MQIIKKVVVMLSSYNGERYIEEQINSILNQIGVKVVLYVRDDGSTDGTLEILKKYEARKLIKLVIGENLYVTKSFFEIMNYVEEADYYAFSDQDDIWLDCKLKKAVDELEKFDNNKPSLYFSELTPVDNEMERIKKGRSLGALTLEQSLICNNVPGCTEVFNKCLFDTIKNKIPQFARMHDHWTYLVCKILDGNIFYDNNSYILYRQHSHNEVGFRPGFLKMIKRYYYSITRHRCERSKQAQELLRYYKGEISDEDLEKVILPATYSDNIYNAFLFMRDKRYAVNIKYRFVIIVAVIFRFF